MGFSIVGIFKSIGHFFTSDKVNKVEQTVSAILPVALQYVQAIDTLTGGNKTVEQVLKVADVYGVPLSQADLTGGQTALNNALMNIAVNLTTKALAQGDPSKAAVASNLVTSAVTLAVSLAHS